MQINEQALTKMDPNELKDDSAGAENAEEALAD
jgi:hypothetical protein